MYVIKARTHRGVRNDSETHSTDVTGLRRSCNPVTQSRAFHCHFAHPVRSGYTIAYLTVDSQSDAMALQHDLDLLAVWERTWQMEFHPDKCQVLRVTNKKSANIITYDYILHGQTLSVVSEVKYLGLTLSDDLKWDKHIGKAISKANSTMAVLRQNVFQNRQSYCIHSPCTLSCGVLQRCLEPLH